MDVILSYFRDYFDPLRPAPLASHSAGLIAANLFHTLERYGTVGYFDRDDAPAGLCAELALAHFWNFRDLCRWNRCDHRIAFYSIADPDWMRTLLTSAAEEFGVPFPYWDQPPAGFDHAGTMSMADRVLLVGNQCTLATFPSRWRGKIRLLNYRVDPPLALASPAPGKRRGFCYPVTHCDLRKGFMDVLRTWSGIDPRQARLQVIGAIRPPWDALLRRHNTGSLNYHGFLPSSGVKYWRVLSGCRFAFVPTYAEGQMGTLLEAVLSSCLPIATPESGLDERVLAWGIPIRARDIEGQRAAISEALAMSDEEWLHRVGAMLAAARAYHTWVGFRSGVLAAVDELLDAGRSAAEPRPCDRRLGKR
jgi:hypothetical protein